MSDVAIFSESFQIPADTQGVELNILRKCIDKNLTYSAEKTVLMVHGATYSSGSLYDTPVQGASFMDHLATAGFDVYAVDIRGYGGSTRPIELQQPALANAPLGRTEVAVRDFTSAANFVLRTRNLEQLNVFGMSWGGTVAAVYAAKNGVKVRRLGLLAPQWLSNKPIPIDSGGALGAWRVVNMDAAKQHWLSSAPVAKRDGLIPVGAFESWAANSLRYESDESLRAQNSFKSGNGPIQDIRDYWIAGKPYYDPADIEVPLILIHGEWDIDVTIELAKEWFLQAKASPEKRWLEIGEATHMLLLEKNRMHAIDALIKFFE
ncbi:alpha/beta hydrolase [Erwinia typographi]|uniref:Alpha/beta hydrolase n=1 Tax=Erwinia typographi TaxID=371042 RepID=A0A0A3YMH1_9GAMM|nr:alpha/beta fold hydrolase [Erwinia typographi]KGT86491.1 alpha/beta hydrolase [Erwinia typographi]